MWCIFIQFSAIGVPMDTDSHDSMNNNPSVSPVSGDSGSRGKGTTTGPYGGGFGRFRRTALLKKGPQFTL